MLYLSLDFSNLKNFISEKYLDPILSNIQLCHDDLENRQGPASGLLGWKTPQISELVRNDIETVANSLRQKCELFIVIGIGGSYIGSQAGLTFLQPFFSNQLGTDCGPSIYFSGHNISSDYHSELLDLVEKYDVCLNVISKSGTTTEPAIAFRLFKELIEKKYGVDGAKDRIVVTTNSNKGPLNDLAAEQGYQKFIIPDDVGGRFSVLSPVGLLPMAVAGIDIGKLLAGACKGEELYSQHSVMENDAYQYAAYRYLLYQKDLTTEILASFQPSLHHFAEWWKQLVGELSLIHI